MPRVKRGPKRIAYRQKTLKAASGYFLTKSKLNRSAQEAVEKALKYAYVGRRQKKRDYRALWIVRIGAACRQAGVSYSKFIAGLKKAREQGRIPAGALVACVLTGHGLKDPDTAVRTAAAPVFTADPLAEIERELAARAAGA